MIVGALVNVLLQLTRGDDEEKEKEKEAATSLKTTQFLRSALILRAE